MALPWLPHQPINIFFFLCFLFILTTDTSIPSYWRVEQKRQRNTSRGINLNSPTPPRFNISALYQGCKSTLNAEDVSGMYIVLWLLCRMLWVCHQGLQALSTEYHRYSARKDVQVQGLLCTESMSSRLTDSVRPATSSCTHLPNANPSTFCLLTFIQCWFGEEPLVRYFIGKQSPWEVLEGLCEWPGHDQVLTWQFFLLQPTRAGVEVLGGAWLWAKMFSGAGNKGSSWPVGHPPLALSHPWQRWSRLNIPLLLLTKHLW